jgi:hypothetical protein
MMVTLWANVGVLGEFCLYNLFLALFALDPRRFRGFGDFFPYAGFRYDSFQPGHNFRPLNLKLIGTNYLEHLINENHIPMALFILLGDPLIEFL